MFAAGRLGRPPQAPEERGAQDVTAVAVSRPMTGTDWQGELSDDYCGVEKTKHNIISQVQEGGVEGGRRKDKVHGAWGMMDYGEVVGEAATPTANLNLAMIYLRSGWFVNCV